MDLCQAITSSSVGTTGRSRHDIEVPTGPTPLRALDQKGVPVRTGLESTGINSPKVRGLQQEHNDEGARRVRGQLGDNADGKMRKSTNARGPSAQERSAPSQRCSGRRGCSVGPSSVPPGYGVWRHGALRARERRSAELLTAMEVRLLA